MGEFVHLHVHTEYSLLDGAIRIKDLVARVKELGMDSVAITDHGVMYGVIELYKECQKQGVKPILGSEVYLAPRSRFDKETRLDNGLSHLILLAKNNEGYQNLMKLVSIGFTEGFYYKPRIDMESLKKYSKGLICTSACLAGNIPRALLNGQEDRARELLEEYIDIFGKDDFYIELQDNGIEEQIEVNQKLIKLAREYGLKMIATCDAHYLKKEDARVHEVLLCIQTGKTMNDPDRMKFQTDEFYIKSPEEVRRCFENLPEVLSNTVEIAEKCNVEIEFGKIHLPTYELPSGENEEAYFRRICEEGLIERYGEDVSQDLKDRLNYEIEVITKMGYINYFFIVYDYIKFAKDNGIMVGPGRGSAAGSIAAYCMKITDIDPLKYGLIFERFLNPERVSMPDIDVDFCYERRQEVIEYVIRKYGKDRVSQIITFGTMAARGAIRDVGRALGVSYAETDVIAKNVPNTLGMTINKAMEVNPELKKLYDESDTAKQVIDVALKLEGLVRHASIHAAGVVIANKPTVEYVPLYKNDEGSITTQFTMTTLEELGLLKMDFLGLRTLTVIRDALRFIKQTTGKDIDIEKLDMTDKKPYELISEGKTVGVFQLESAGITQFMKELKPESIEDIIAGISLYRPGPMDQIPRYIRNKNNPEHIEYTHPALEPILNVTYGCMVYQEQVMQIVRDLAGYSWGRSDLVRRAMAKKKDEVMRKERENFIHGMTDEQGNVTVPGCIRNGISEVDGNKIFDEMIDFAKYAFNKSHAAAYAVIAFQTAWLKVYYPAEFMSAMLNSFLSSSEKIAQYIYECKQMGIEILPPDVNESFVQFSIKNGNIRFGLCGVKNVGDSAVKNIVKTREEQGNFKNFFDFCEKIDFQIVNKRCIESLIKCGAFDSVEPDRGILINNFERIIDGIQSSRKKNLDGQVSMFDMSIKTENKDAGFTMKMDDTGHKFTDKELLTMEKEMLGFFISGHPLKDYIDIIKRTDNISTIEILGEDSKAQDEQKITLSGIITSKKTKLTKTNNMMAFVSLEDLYGDIEVIIFPKILAKYERWLQVDSIVTIEGRLSLREDEEPKIICETVREIGTSSQAEASQTPAKKGSKKVFFKINETNKDKLDTCLALLQFFSGDIPVYVYFEEEKITKMINRTMWTLPNAPMVEELKRLLGEENVKLVIS